MALQVVLLYNLPVLPGWSVIAKVHPADDAVDSFIAPWVRHSYSSLAFVNLFILALSATEEDNMSVSIYTRITRDSNPELPSTGTSVSPAHSPAVVTTNMYNAFCAEITPSVLPLAQLTAPCILYGARHKYIQRVCIRLCRTNARLPVWYGWYGVSSQRNGVTARTPIIDFLSSRAM